MWPFNQKQEKCNKEEVEKDIHRLVLIRAELEDINSKYVDSDRLDIVFSNLDGSLDFLIRNMVKRVAKP